MEREQLVEQVRVWVQQKSRAIDNASEAVTADTDLLATGLLDSLGLIELVAYVEETTKRHIDLLDIDPEQFTTIRGLCQAALNGAAVVMETPWTTP